MSKIFERIISKIPNFKIRMTRISMDIAEQIYQYMKQAGNMKQKDLAEKLGKKESEISKWLNGNHNFTIETIAKMEDVFDKDILLVPMFAEEDLKIKIENPKSVSFEKTEIIFSIKDGNVITGLSWIKKPSIQDQENEFMDRNQEPTTTKEYKLVENL
ncbi:MAG: helix-turn-helix transcriptional regulator [Ignavibacteria bacterium]|jgi:transcriptional regulator with XRE-family HTH domain